jgi:pimeloyl-ACP methyl ester carboxylesterase
MTATSTAAKTSRRAAHIERKVDVNGISVRYLEGGVEHPGPPVVLAHGFIVGADLWYPYTFPAVAERFHVYALDLPGFGGSGELQEYSVEAYGRFMIAFLDGLGLDAIQLVGHSMGGQVAIGAAAREPERIRRLALIESAGLPRTGSHVMASLMMLADRSTFDVALYPRLLRLFLRSRVFGPCYKMIYNDSVYPLLDNLTMPTLVVWGSRDRVIPLEYATLFARNIPRARLTIMRGCGHRPFYQKPALFNKILFGFLKED